MDLLLLQRDDYRLIRLRVKLGLCLLLGLIWGCFRFQGFLASLSVLRRRGGGLDQVLMGVGQQLLPVEALLFDRILGFVVLVIHTYGVARLRVLCLVVHQI